MAPLAPQAAWSGESSTTAARRYFSASVRTASKGEPEEPKSTVMEAFRFMLPHLWPKNRPDHKMRVLMSLSFVFGAKVLFVAVPFYFKGIIDELVGPKAAVAATATDAASDVAGEVVASTGVLAVQQWIDMAHVAFGPSVFALVVAYGIVRTLASFTSEMRTAVFSKVGADAFTNINESIFMKLHGLELNYHVSRKTGGVTKILDRGSRAFNSMAWCTMFVIAPTGFEMVLVCALLQQQVGIEFVAIALTAVVVYVAFTTKVTNWRTKLRDGYNEHETKTSSIVVDSLLNYETVKYFGNEAFEARRLREANEAMNRYVVKLDQSMSALNFGQQFIFIAAASSSLYLASTGVVAGTMTVGDLVLVDALLLQLYTPMSWLGVVYREMTQSTQNMQAMLGLLNRPTEMKDAPEAKPLEFADGTIEFRDAKFMYNDKALLDGINLTIPGGSLVAFVGPSGTGKTTIFRLLFRFMSLNSGSILVDGQDIANVQMASLRKRIGVIPQDTVMFNDTVAYNIEYGKLGATQEEIEHVARQASMHDAVLRLEKGYETNVGERGLKLSGGEKQRVAIARVLLQDPDIILADEATSALDTRTEAAVIRTLCESSEGKKRTVIMIAHRLATVRNCDTIFVLNTHGHIAERGSHHELLAHRGLYHQLWSQQLDEKVHDRQITQADEMSEQPEATTTHVAIAEDLAAVPPK
jgi:ABC-type transport system involved in Fe-S cluster assembly fused permease/ATPase subunit